MSGYHFTRKAASDLASIQDYIARDRPRASLDWVRRLEKRCLLLARNPRWGRPREDLRPGLRSFSFGHYLLFYRETPRGVEIVRVLHAARDINSQFP